MEKFKATLMDEAAVARALKRISHEILEKNNGTENLCIIGIKRRGTALAKILSDNIFAIEGVRVPTGELDITFYRDDLTAISPDPVIHPTELDFSVADKKVILLPIRGDYVGKNVPTSKNEVIAVKIPPYDDMTAAELYEV